MMNMTKEELLRVLNQKPRPLVESSLGLVDVFEVKDGYVSYGFIASGRVATEPIEKFLSRVKV